MPRISERLDEYRAWAALVKEQTGKSWPEQLREIYSLRGLGGNCGISDYYWYRLYDPSYQAGRGAADFLGWKMQGQFSLALNPRNAVLPAWDKTVFMQLALSGGLPVAPVWACYHPATRISPALGLHLRSKAEVAAMLRDVTVYPLFGKPAYSQQGYGSAFLQSYESDTDSVVLLDGNKMSLEIFMDRIENSVDTRYHRSECGYVFQKPLVSAPEIQALTNWPAICGVRIVCLNGPEGVIPIRAIWKVAVAPNHVDNFSLGKNGNLLANVDLATGEITKMIGGFWPKTRIYERHPGSDASFAGFRLPGWAQLLEACAQGGRVFPLMHVHHWDFAITESGPQILELNDLGSTELAQVHGHGLLTPFTRDFLKRHASANFRDWVNSL